MTITSKDWAEILLRIFIAVLIGGVIGIEREYKNRPAGMRTHVLVALGSMSMALLESLIRGGLDPTESSFMLNAGRITSQVVSGIGFLGAGTIFISKRKIGGLTTAASLWCTACMGLLVGYGYYMVALAMSVLVVLTLAILQKVVRVNAIKSLEVLFTDRNETMDFINNFFQQMNIKVLDVDFYVENSDVGKKTQNIYKNIYTLKLPSNVHYTSVVVHLSEYSHIRAVHTRNV